MSCGAQAWAERQVARRKPISDEIVLKEENRELSHGSDVFALGSQNLS